MDVTDQFAGRPGISLLARLLTGVLALAALGLVSAAGITTILLRQVLLDGIDQQLSVTAEQAGHDLRREGAVPSAHERVAYPEGTYAELRRDDLVVASFIASAGPMTDDRPLLPGDLSSPQQALPHRFTTPAADDVPAYRVAVAPASSTGEVMLTAVPLGSVTSTLTRLAWIQALVIIVVLVLLAFAARAAIRIGLRPVGDIAQTAAAIAEGDLARRVPADARTEIGQLGTVLNAMLAHIQDVVEDRDASRRRLRQFVADAGHELRTPLTTVRGYAELLRRGGIPDQSGADDALWRIEQEAVRMEGLVDDLLLLARLDRRRPLRQDPVDLAVLAGDAVTDARIAAPDRMITLAVESTPIVRGDDARLRQVAANLLANTRVHTPVGTAVVVRVATADAAAVLDVADDGPGIDAQSVTSVFDRFYRSDRARARTHGGSGLGLAIVASIVEAHGGTVEVFSVAGEGATFRIHLPLEDCDQSTGDSQPSLSPVSGSADSLRA